MSSHLGFNRFIITSDKYIPFIRRNRNVSIGKDTLGMSIIESLKAKYVLNSNKKFELSGLKCVVINENKDEVQLSDDEVYNFDISKNLIAVYRDIVEGDKPQLLFCYDLDVDRFEFTKNFYIKTADVQKNSENLWDREQLQLRDGSEFIWIKSTDLYKIKTAPQIDEYYLISYQLVINKKTILSQSQQHQ